MKLSDTDIKDYMQRQDPAYRLVISPYDERSLQPNGYDIHLGNTFKVWREARIIRPGEDHSEYMDEIVREEGECLTLYPGM